VSEHSEKCNALPDDQRLMINAMLVEAEIRIVEAEKKRLLDDYRRAIRGHNTRIASMRSHLRRIETPTN
jgi:hypothetical protein